MRIIKNEFLCGESTHTRIELNNNNKIICRCYIAEPSIIEDKIMIEFDGSTESYSGDSDLNFIFLYDLESFPTGKGYGTLFFKKLIEYLKEIGKNRIYLDVNIINTKAQRFYQKLGFIQKWKSYENYRYYLMI